MRLMGWGTGMVGLVAGLGWARADFAPLQVGNRWEYGGTIQIRAAGVATGRMREWLTAEVRSERKAGDTTYYEVRLRDSLYARERYAQASGSWQTLADSVLGDTRTLASLGDKVSWVPAANDSGRLAELPAAGTYPVPFSVFGSLRILSAHENPPGQPTPLPGAPTDRQVMQTAFAEEEGSWVEWYAEGYGSAYEKSQAASRNSCGPSVERELLLDVFNGSDVSIGVPPPDPALPKAGKSACSSIRRLGRGMLAFGEAAPVPVDLAGRRVRAP